MISAALHTSRTGLMDGLNSSGPIPRFLLPLICIFVLYQNIHQTRYVFKVGHSKDVDDGPSSLEASGMPSILTKTVTTETTNNITLIINNTAANEVKDGVGTPVHGGVQHTDDEASNSTRSSSNNKPNGRKPPIIVSPNNSIEPTINSATKNNYQGSESEQLLGITPRLWKLWNPRPTSSATLSSNKGPSSSKTNQTDPLNNFNTLCFDPGPKLRSARQRSKEEMFPLDSIAFDDNSMFKRGLDFLKPMKVGGSSATGVNIRLSKNLASRLQKPFKVCENNFDHAMGWMFQRRNKNRSFLWTLLRQPTKRAISAFWHFRVSRQDVEPNYENFVREMKDNSHYYLRMHSMKKFVPTKPGSSSDNPVYKDDEDFRDAANKIMKDYDFMAVTERFDESMVVLNMLLNGESSKGNTSDVVTQTTKTEHNPEYIPLGDMLYLNAKTKGGYDDGGNGGKCAFIQPSNVTSEMKTFIDSSEWHRRVRWDEALWRAANRSLDLTIDRLGRSKFERNLQLYLQAQRLVNARCQSEALVPCPEAGWKRAPEDTNCLFQDSGCAWSCIDQFVAEWNYNVTAQQNMTTEKFGLLL